ncbi:pilus assembly protein TadG-related protein [Acetobacter ghanensis]|uniref:TadE/TadG family type IV pilus assembly protein n=1 Tax=Acetobacter ghanensis TaxID=431306 RepID=UPI003D3489C9
MTRRMDSKGVIAVIAALAIPTLLLLVCGSVDLTRIYIVKQRAQAGVDAAALVIGAEGSADEPAKGQADAEKIFWSNFNSSSTSQTSGVLNSSVVTMNVGDYNSTTKQVPVTVTVSVPLIFSMLQKSGATTITAVGYATFNQQTGSGRGWMALLCYKTSDASPPTKCQANYPSYAALQVVPSSTDPVIIDGPVCYSDKSYSGELGTACLSTSSIVNQPSLTLSTNATLTAQSTDTNGNSCANCDSVQLDGGFTVTAGTTTITGMNVDNHGSTFVLNSTLTVENAGTYHSSGGLIFNTAAFNGLSNEVTKVDDETLLTDSTLTLNSNGQYCDNGINAVDSTITATNGASLGCASNPQSSPWSLNNSQMLLSSDASLYIRGGSTFTVVASTFDINDSLVNIGVNAGVNLNVMGQSTLTIENDSTLYVSNYLDIQGSSTFTSSASTISASGLQLNTGGVLNLGNSTKFTVTGQTNTAITSALNISGASSATISGYAPIFTGAVITVTGSNSSLVFNGQTPLSNATINVTNGASVTFNNAQSMSNVVLNVSGGGSATFKNVNGYTVSGITGTVNGSQSAINFAVSSQRGSLNTNIASENGGVLSITYP